MIYAANGLNVFKKKSGGRKFELTNRSLQGVHTKYDID